MPDADPFSEMIDKAKKAKKLDETTLAATEIRLAGAKLEQMKVGEETKKEAHAPETSAILLQTKKLLSELQEPTNPDAKTVVDQYGNVTVYKVPGDPLLLYSVPVPRATEADLVIIKTIKEAATRLISVSPFQIRDLEQRRTVYQQKILDIMKGSPELRIPAHRHTFYAQAVVREMVGYGLIDSLVDDDQLEEIMINGPQTPVYVFHRKYEMMKTNVEFVNDQEVQDLINRIAREVGRRVDISSPLLDARLPDGSRINATIPPATVDGSSLTVRKFRADPYSVVDLIQSGTISSELAAFLWMSVQGQRSKPANILIAGGTGGGKTTLLNVLASMVPAQERIITIEDTHELNLPLEHWIKLEARPPGLEGRGELTLDILTKNALRMRPDRIIVGEVRHDEAFTLFTAMNTGHAGSMGTVHANSAQETLVRVTSPPMNVPAVMLAGLDLLVLIHRLHDPQKGTIRRVSQVAELAGTLEGRPVVQTLFERDPVDDTIVRTAIPSQYLKKLEDFTGMHPKDIETELEKRKNLLDGLVHQNMRGQKTVTQTMTAYLLKQTEARRP